MTEKRFTLGDYSQFFAEIEYDESFVIVGTDYKEEICDLLNEQDENIKYLKEEIEQLKFRNKNQCKQLTELWQLIVKRDWETLIRMDDERKRNEELLQMEYGHYEPNNAQE